KGAHCFANARDNSISVTREMSKMLREGDPLSRYRFGHEFGHLALHRGLGLKPLMSSEGNRQYTFIPPEQSAERQAWQASRALFLPKDVLLLDAGELVKRFVIPIEAARQRIDEVRS